MVTLVYLLSLFSSIFFCFSAIVCNILVLSGRRSPVAIARLHNPEEKDSENCLLSGIVNNPENPS